MAYEEINLAKLFLISALSMGVSQRTKWIVLSCWLRLQTFTFLQGLRWMTASWRLTCQSLFRWVKGGRTDCVIDCSADVTWTGLHRCSCTAARNSGYAVKWRERQWRDVWKIVEQERGGKIARMRREADGQWWITAGHSAVTASEQLIWCIDEEPLWGQKRAIVSVSRMMQVNADARRITRNFTKKNL